MAYKIFSKEESKEAIKPVGALNVYVELHIIIIHPHAIEMSLIMLVFQKNRLEKNSFILGDIFSFGLLGKLFLLFL